MSHFAVLVVQIHNGNFIQKEEIEKPMNEVLTIGRDGGDVAWRYPWISRQHGKLWIEGGLFTKHLEYEDYSSYGTSIIEWDGLIPKARVVHGKKTKVRPGDWLLFYNAEQMTGVLLVPFVM